MDLLVLEKRFYLFYLSLKTILDTRQYKKLLLLDQRFLRVIWDFTDQ